MSSDFQPITTQEEFDERLKGRLARERERWEKESVPKERVEALTEESSVLARELEAKERELEGVHKEHRMQELERTTKALLTERGVEDEARQKRVMRLLDFDGALADEEPVSLVEWQLKQLANDVPELLSPKEFPTGAGSGLGSRKPVLTRKKPLTEEELAAMRPEQMAEPGVMAKIDAFMKGER